VSLLVWSFPSGPSGFGDPASSYATVGMAPLSHQDSQAPPPRQGGDTNTGGEIGEYKKFKKFYD